MTLVDSNVFVLDLRYERDPLFAVNRAFLGALAAAEKYSPPGSTFVTWDSTHFAGRTAMRLSTPSEWLATRRA